MADPVTPPAQIALSNVFASPRTTLSGALSVLVALIGSQIVPQIAAYFQEKQDSLATWTVYMISCCSI